MKTNGHTLALRASPVRTCPVALRAILLATAATALPVPAVLAQCTPQWFATGGVGGDPAPAVYALTLWDRDGEGPQQPVLVVGGVFTTVGAVPAGHVAIWDGTSWNSLGAGLDAPVDSFSILQDGSLVASGSFTASGTTPLNRIARWDGTSWTSFGSGMNNEVHATAVLPGGDLVAAGSFSTAGGTSVNRIARWNGSSWSAMGNMNNSVWTLLVTPAGELIAGGQFTYTASVPGNKVARYNGSTWTGMGTVNNTVLSLGITADGDIVAGGLFTAPGSRVVRWVGNGWAAMGLGILGPVWSFNHLPDGTLVAGGTFMYAGSNVCNGIATWNGSDWNPLGQGVANPNVLALSLTPTGDLFAGGGFTTADGLNSPGLARWANSGAPAVIDQPQSRSSCPAGPADFSTTVAGDPYAFNWQALLTPGVWTDLSDGALIDGGVTIATVEGSATPNVRFTSMSHFLSVRSDLTLRCSITNLCGTTLSDPATLTLCPADFDCTGFVDTDDFDDFVHAFEAGTDDADFDASGFVDTDDFDAFVHAFELGC